MLANSGGTMQRAAMLRLFVLLLLTTLHAVAEIVSFPSYNCQIDLPDNAPWQRQLPREIPAGEIIFNAQQEETGNAILICYLPDIPAVDLRTEGVTASVLRTLTSFGLQSTPPKMISTNKIDFLQFVAKSTLKEDYVCVARAALKNKAIYLLMMIGPGGAERGDDKNFTRISESFRFVEPVVEMLPLAANPLFPLYRKGAFGCAAAAVALLAGFAIVMFATRRQYR